MPHTLPVNPAAAVKAGKVRAGPGRCSGLPPRVERWQETGEIPARVMVWSRDQCGAFLDAIEAERLYALYHLAAYYGLRRVRAGGLAWADVDLATRRVHIRQAQVEDDLDSTK